jgi:hypothetical protein
VNVKCADYRLDNHGQYPQLKWIMRHAEEHERSSMAASGLNEDGERMFGVCMMDIGVPQPQAGTDTEEFEVSVAQQYRPGKPSGPSGSGGHGGARRYRPNNVPGKNGMKFDKSKVRGDASYNGEDWDDTKACCIHRTHNHCLNVCRERMRADCKRCEQVVGAGNLPGHLKRLECPAPRCDNCQIWTIRHTAENCPNPWAPRKGRGGRKEGFVVIPNDGSNKGTKRPAAAPPSTVAPEAKKQKTNE